MQVGGLLILTTGLAHYALMQHTPPLRALYVPLFLFFSLQSSYKIPSNLYVYKYRLGVNHGLSWRIFLFLFFSFRNKTFRCIVCDCAVFSSKCRLTRKPAEAYSVFQDHTWYPHGIFFSSGFFCFLCRVLHRHPAFKAKNKHREFTWGGKDWGFTISYQSKILTNNPMTYVGHSQKTRWPESPALGFEWNQGMKRRRSVCERYTVKSSLCQINRVIKCRKKKTI